MDESSRRRRERRRRERRKRERKKEEATDEMKEWGKEDLEK